MTDGPKGVKVEAIHGTMQEPQVHPEATYIRVEDGHLHVCKMVDDGSGPDSIAIYAPGKWLNAVVN